MKMNSLIYYNIKYCVIQGTTIIHIFVPYIEEKIKLNNYYGCKQCKVANAQRHA